MHIYEDIIYASNKIVKTEIGGFMFCVEPYRVISGVSNEAALSKFLLVLHQLCILFCSESPKHVHHKYKHVPHEVRSALST